MQFVEPIRSIEKIEEMKIELKKTGTRNYLLFYLGINTGLRISDIIKLQVKDVIGVDGVINNHIEIIEEKTKKKKKFKINPMLGEELKIFVKDMKLDDCIFKSRKGNNKPMTRVQAYRILNDAATTLGIADVGTHTLRKTFRLPLL